MAFSYKNFASLGVNLNRQAAGPLDVSNVFNSQADLNYYLTGGTGDKNGVSAYWADMPATYPYPGQVVALVVDEEVSIFVIKEQGGAFITEPIAAKASVDSKTVVYNANDELTIAGYADAATGARLQKTATGVAWVVPGEASGTMTDAEVAEAISGLQTDIGELSTAIGSESVEGGAAATGIYKRIEDLEAADGVLLAAIDEMYTNAEIDSAIAAAVNNANHLTRQVVTALPTEGISETVVYMVPRTGSGNDVHDEYMYINGTWELIGNTQVDLSDYAQKSEILVKSVGADFVVSEAGQLTFASNAAPAILGTNITQLPISGVSGLSTALDGKVAVEEGKSLVSDTLITKLNGLAEIKSVSGEFSLTDGELSVNAIAANKVTGLPDALTAIESLQTESATYLKGVSLNNIALAMDENKRVNIPLASAAALGVVKSATGDNKVSVDTDGTMSVEAVNVSSLTQTAGEWLILNGGNATGTVESL